MAHLAFVCSISQILESPLSVLSPRFNLDIFKGGIFASYHPVIFNNI